MRRWTVLVPVTLAMFLLAGASADALVKPQPPRTATVAGLHLTYPARFDGRSFASCSYRVTGVRGACVHGLVVGSYQLPSRPELGAPSALLPRFGVAFELYKAPVQHGVVAPTITFPLSLDAFHIVGRGFSPSDSQRELFVRVKGVNYWAMAWVGQNSNGTDRTALRSIISSIQVG